MEPFYYILVPEYWTNWQELASLCLCVAPPSASPRSRRATAGIDQRLTNTDKRIRGAANRLQTLAA
eukprot:7641438-Alexandrium_andersonii.AAC.1